MMYYLNKIVGCLTSPLLLSLLFVIVGLIVAMRGRRKIGFSLIGFAMIWLWLWSTSIATRLVGAPLEYEFLVDGRVPMVEEFPTADAIVLLGGGMGVNTNFSPYAEMSARADRVWQAARLYKAGKAAKIISTGFSSQDSTLGLLKDLELPEKCALFFEARNTEEEAKVVKSLGLKKILLVTSAWHMKRARLMFEKYAPEVNVVCAPADFEYSMTRMRAFSVKDFLPDSALLFDNSVAIREWIGLVGYRLFR